MSGVDFGDWAMSTHRESAIRSADTRNGERDRTIDISHSSSLSDANMGQDLEEFLRAVYEAQSRLASV